MDNIDKKSVNDEDYIAEIRTCFHYDIPVKSFDDGKDWIYTLTDTKLTDLAGDFELLVKYGDIEDKLLSINSEYSKTIRLFDGIDVTFVVYFDKDKDTDEAILKILSKVAKDVLLSKLGHDDEAIYLLLKSIFNINFKLSLYKCSKVQNPEPVDKVDTTPETKPNDEAKHTLMLNPFGYPRDLHYAFSGYPPDLRGIVLYGVLEYRYHDSEGYDHLAIFSKEDMKKLGSIGMHDYYFTTVQHKDCKPIEFVFTINTDMPTLRALPNPICIKIWARVCDDDTNFVGESDSVATEYLRGIFIDHFKIGLEKSTTETDKRDSALGEPRVINDSKIVRQIQHWLKQFAGTLQQVPADYIRLAVGMDHPAVGKEIYAIDVQNEIRVENSTLIKPVEPGRCFSVSDGNCLYEVASEKYQLYKVDFEEIKTAMPTELHRGQTVIIALKNKFKEDDLFIRHLIASDVSITFPGQPGSEYMYDGCEILRTRIGCFIDCNTFSLYYGIAITNESIGTKDEFEMSHYFENIEYYIASKKPESTVEKPSFSKDAIIFHRTGSGEGPATQVIYPKSNYVYDIKSVTADVEKKNKEKFQNFVKGWLESQDEEYILKNLNLECWDMKVLNADHPAGMLRYKINDKKGLHPVFLVNIDGDFVAMKWDTMTAVRGRIYTFPNDPTMSKNIEITYPETELIIMVKVFNNGPINETILRQTVHHIDIIMATSKSEEGFVEIETNRIDMFRHIRNAIGWKRYYAFNPVYKEIEERVDLSSYTTFDLLRQLLLVSSFDLSDPILIVHQTEVVIPSIVPLGGGITRTMNVTYGGYPIKVDVHFDTAVAPNDEDSKKSYDIILHIWASCKTENVEKYYDFQKIKGITEGLGDMLAKNIAATALGQFNIGLANMK